MTIPVEDLRAAGLGSQVETVSRAVAEYLDDGTAGSVAVVSEPYAGRSSLLDYAAELLEDHRRVELEAVVGDPEAVPAPDGRPLLVDDCHALYRREIGGFDALARFREAIALADTLVVTSWNRYAWRYLDAVRDLSTSFSDVVEIPRLDADQIQAVVSTHFEGDMPRFVETDTAGRIKTIEMRRLSIEVRGRELNVPLPAFNPEYLASVGADDGSEGLEAVVFEKLRRVSHGNPGIATRLWERAVQVDDDGQLEIGPGFVVDPVTELPIADDDRARLLQNIVANETLPVGALDRITHAVDVATELGWLADQGIVSIDEEDRATITPAGVHPVVAALERRRFLW